jgi:hypothetical protein
VAARVRVTRPLLTVLTAPIPSAAARLDARVRGVARTILGRSGAPSASPYPGHYGLVRSVVEGLRAIDADFNFNPSSLGRVGRVVYAPANEALAQAVALRRRGAIDVLVAGPTNAFHPDECGGIILTPEIDVLIVASDWVRELYLAEAPQLADKIRVCQAGVDAGYWNAPAGARRDRVVVYQKDAPPSLREDVERLLRTRALETTTVRYGEYDRGDYKAMLAEAAMAVFLSTFETQGLALAEAWAMNVPTLVWDPQAPTQWAGSRPFTAGSSAPFLTAATGRTWKTIEELDAHLTELAARPPSLAPRDWVLAHMTDAIGARALYRLVEDAAYNTGR